MVSFARALLIMVWMLVGLSGPVLAQSPVAGFEQIRFHSSFWVNLHFTLYAEAHADTRNGSAPARVLVNGTAAGSN